MKSLLKTVLITLFVLLPLGQVIGQGNLLENPSFESGYYLQDGVVEYAVPNGWRLHLIDNAPSGYSEGNALRPELVVWPRWQAPEAERDVFWVNGDHILKMFKGNAPVYFALSQNVDGLTPGETYTFSGSVFADVVAGYGDAGKIAPPSNDAAAAGVRMGASAVNAEWRNEKAIAYSGWWGPGNPNDFYLNHNRYVYTFTATSESMTVWVEMFTRYGFANSGYFLDGFVLQAGGNSATAATVPTSAAAPTTAPAAAATTAPAAQAPSAAPTAMSPAALTAQAVALNPSGAAVAAGGPPTAMPAAALTQQASQWSDLYPTALPASAAPPRVVNVPQSVASNNTTDSGSAKTIDRQEVPEGGTTYIVKPGDTLWVIAYRFYLRVPDLLEANNITNRSIISPGTKLVIPDKGGSAPVADTTADDSESEDDAPAPTATPAATATPAPELVNDGNTLTTDFGRVATKNANGDFIYTIQDGDNMYYIAWDFKVKMQELADANGIKNIRLIAPGQDIIIPVSD